MKFNPRSDAELNNFELLPRGEYDFEVIKAKDKVSSAGNEMIELELDVYADDGKKSRVFDYLLEIVAYKLKHFCQAVGLSNEYDIGNLSADMCIGRSGRCKVEIKHDKTGEYSDKNIIRDYCKPENTVEDIDVNDIPF